MLAQNLSEKRVLSRLTSVLPFQWLVLYYSFVPLDRSYIELKIESLEQDPILMLAVLRRRINAYNSRSYRLYPEILSRAASYLPNDALVKATHVSYHWCSILLSSPRLWTLVNFLREKEALVFLKRSKSAPISGFMDVPYRPSHTTSIDLLNQHARLLLSPVLDFPSTCCCPSRRP